MRDRDSGAYNLAYFVDYAGKEFYKARRYGRAFSLVVLSVDNVEQMFSTSREGLSSIFIQFEPSVQDVGRAVIEVSNQTSRFK